METTDKSLNPFIFINEPATIHYIPFEVLRDSLVYLIKQFGPDLASPSLTCRAWRAVALELMNSRKRFVEDEVNVEGFICGLHLRSFVEFEMFSIKYLVISLKRAGKECIQLIARAVGPTLSSLIIDCLDKTSPECYEALGVFFEQCDGIRNLRLVNFDFGDDPVAFSRDIKEGFGRLSHLN